MKLPQIAGLGWGQQVRRRAALRRDSRDTGDGLTGGLARGPPTLIPGRRAPPRPPQNLAADSPVAVAGAGAEPVCPPRRAVRFRRGVARSYGARERSVAATSGFAPGAASVASAALRLPPRPVRGDRADAGVCLRKNSGRSWPPQPLRWGGAEENGGKR